MVRWKIQISRSRLYFVVFRPPNSCTKLIFPRAACISQAQAYVSDTTFIDVDIKTLQTRYGSVCKGLDEEILSGLPNS